jgi:hypothetical protein
MKRIRPSPNPHQWPRQKVKTVECRKRDLVLRIADWTSDKDEPAYDVEIYVGGVYDWNLSRSFTHKEAAIVFAQKQISELL